MMKSISDDPPKLPSSHIREDMAPAKSLILRQLGACAVLGVFCVVGLMRAHRRIAIMLRHKLPSSQIILSDSKDSGFSLA